MTIIEPKYDGYLKTDFGRRTLVRDFGDCVIWAADTDTPLLILDDPRRRRVTLFEYDSIVEREHDIRLVKLMPGDGGAASAIGAFLKPGPPSRFAGNANPLPGLEEGAG